MSPLFAPDSIWNQPLVADAPRDPCEAYVLADLLAQVKGCPVSLGAGVPVYTVGPQEPGAPVHLSSPAAPWRAQLARVLAAGVPIPAGAQPASFKDHVLVVISPSTDEMWELWHASLQADGWHADWGGHTTHLSLASGYARNLVDQQGVVLEQPHWNTCSTSHPCFAGAVTIAELQSGEIPHALALAVDWARAGQWAFPAQRSDGATVSSTCIPEGAHLRLDPALDVAALKLPKPIDLYAIAAQRYGIIVNNRSNGVCFRGESPVCFEEANGYNPYHGPENAPGSPGALYSEWPSRLGKAFPWAHLQLLSMDLRSRPDLTPFIQEMP